MFKAHRSKLGSRNRVEIAGEVAVMISQSAERIVGQVENRIDIIDVQTERSCATRKARRDVIGITAARDIVDRNARHISGGGGYKAAGADARHGFGEDHGEMHRLRCRRISICQRDAAYGWPQNVFYCGSKDIGLIAAFVGCRRTER